MKEKSNIHVLVSERILSFRSLNVKTEADVEQEREEATLPQIDSRDAQLSLFKGLNQRRSTASSPDV